MLMKSTRNFMLYYLLGEKTTAPRGKQSRRKATASIDFDNSDYEDYTPVGKPYQADIPDLVENESNTYEKPYKNVDSLIWDPHKVPEKAVEDHLVSVGVTKRRRRHQRSLYDEEVALFELHRCGYNVAEARTRYANRPAVGPLVDIWSEDEKQIFFQELKKGKNFSAIQKVLYWKSTQEIVDYYYFTKKCRKS